MKVLRSWLSVLFIFLFIVMVSAGELPPTPDPLTPQEESQVFIINFKAVEVRDFWYIGYRICDELIIQCSEWSIFPEPFQTEEEAYEFADETIKRMGEEDKNLQIRPLEKYRNTKNKKWI